MVIWRIKQIMPANGLPMVKKVSHGRRNEISNRIGTLSIYGYRTARLCMRVLNSVVNHTGQIPLMGNNVPPNYGVKFTKNTLYDMGMWGRC